MLLFPSGADTLFCSSAASPSALAPLSFACASQVIMPARVPSREDRKIAAAAGISPEAAMALFDAADAVIVKTGVR